MNAAVQHPIIKETHVNNVVETFTIGYKLQTKTKDKTYMFNAEKVWEMLPSSLRLLF